MKGKAAESFEELHIYQRARELTHLVYACTRQGDFARDFGLGDQIRRASLSVMSNIAEGFERGSSAEFIQFLFIAKGSCGEVRAQLQIARDQNYLGRPEYEKLHDLARRTSGMISNFIAHLQSSAYPGEKFARPARQQTEKIQARTQALREAQLVNIRNQPAREKELQAASKNQPPPEAGRKDKAGDPDEPE